MPLAQPVPTLAATLPHAEYPLTHREDHATASETAPTLAPTPEDRRA
jgi:hypothetical protein